MVEVDFFDSPLQKRVQELLEQATRSNAAKSGRAATKTDPKKYRGRVWVTRPRPGVDRCASAWLIRRFIDRKARFAFAPEDRVPAGAGPLDMFPEGGVGHRGDDCTFEKLPKKFHGRAPKGGPIAQNIPDTA